MYFNVSVVIFRSGALYIPVNLFYSSTKKGGMLGLGHINKGTQELGNPVYEYEYLDQYR